MICLRRAKGDRIVMTWIIRLLLIAGGLLAALLVERDAPSFVVIQGAMGLLVLVSIVAAFAFWRRRR
jgi:hypothetical protein